MTRSTISSVTAIDAIKSCLPSFPYPATPTGGFWSPVTSTINWCEEDYYATVYSAEIVNSLTNILFMYLAYKGLTNCYKNGHDAVYSVAFVGYFIVGFGSFLFHTTLSYPMQLVDELSMIYTTCLMCYATFGFQKTRGFRNLLGLSLVSLAVFITLYYHYLQDPAFHQNAYALLTITVVFRCIYIMERTLRPSYRRSGRARQDAELGRDLTEDEKVERERIDSRDRRILRQQWLMVIYGITVFLGGFGVWGLDNKYCSTIRVWRRQVGLPWGVLLEGHGWWHLMTGTGAYLYITWAIWLRHCLNGRQDEFALDWPSTFFSLPQIVKVEEKTTFANGHHANGTANGTTKKLQ